MPLVKPITQWKKVNCCSKKDCQNEFKLKRAPN